MNPFFHHLGNYARRFRLEWATFLLVSTLTSLSVLRWKNEAPVLPLGVLEAAAFAWLTVRVMLAESSFFTHGGWQVRPVEQSMLGKAKWALFLSALLPAMVVRAWCLHRTVDLSGNAWVEALRREWLPWLAGLIAAAVLVSAIGQRIRATGGRRWMIIIMGLVAAGGLLAVVAAVSPSSSNRGTRSGGYGTTLRSLLPHIPRGERLIAVNDRAGGSVRTDTPLRELLRVPLAAGQTISLPGLRAVVTACQPAGERLAVAVEVTGLPWRLQALGGDPVFVVRYGPGIWGPQRKYAQRWSRLALPGLGSGKLVASGDFMSPLIEPWNRRSWPELLQGAQLVIFAADPGGPPIPPSTAPAPAMSIGEKEMTLALPELPEHPTPQQLAAAAQAAVDQLHAGGWSEQQSRALPLLEKGGAAIVEPLLASGPFSDRAWRHLEPFLVKHATEINRPALLRLLETDGRMGSVMIGKGWKAEALPLLRRHLVDGLPLTLPALLALAAEKNATLAPALRHRILHWDRSRFWQEEDPFMEALRDHPGIDWQQLQSDKWQANAETGTVSRTISERCASTGDRIIFREMAGLWLRGGKLPAKNTLHQWISPAAWDGELKDFPAWLRANFDRLQWDPAAARWTLP
jgi:hypothetical protein